MKNRFHLNSEEKFLVKILALVLVGLIFVAYGNFVRNETIKAASLVDVNDSGYILSFEGEEHYYTFN